MSVEPRRHDPGLESEALRRRAREGARSVSGVLMPILGGAIALFAVIAIAVLDYMMHQGSGRLIKLLLGVAVVLGIALTPGLGMFLFPIITPLLPLTPKLPVPGMNSMYLLMLVIFGPWAFSRVMAQRPIMRRGALTGVILALVAVVGLSVLRGWAFPTGYDYDANKGGLTWFRVSMMFVMYFIPLAMVTGKGPRHRIAWAVVIALLVESLYTMFLGPKDRGGRSLGSIGQPNELGAYLAIATAFVFALLFGTRVWWQRLALLTTGVLGMVALMLAASRGALIAIGLALLVVVGRSSRWGLVLMVLVLAASPLWIPQATKDRIMTTFVESEDSDDAKLEGGSMARVNTWNAILQVVQDHALDGIGFTGLADVLPEIGEDLGVTVKDSSHNTFLRMLSETGVLGLALFLALLWMGWRLGERGMRAARDRFDRQIALGVVGGFLALAVSCAFGDRFWEVMVAGNLWVSCALVDDILGERRGEQPAARGRRAS